MNRRERTKVILLQERLLEATNSAVAFNKKLLKSLDDNSVLSAELEILQREHDIQDKQIGLLGRTLAYEATQNMKLREGLLQLEVNTGTITYKGQKK